MPAIWKDFVSALILSGTVGPSGDIVLILKTQSYRHAYGVNSQRMVIMQSLLDSFAIHSINFHNHWLLKERKTTIYHECILLIEPISNDLSLSLSLLLQIQIFHIINVNIMMKNINPAGFNLFQSVVNVIQKDWKRGELILNIC